MFESIISRLKMAYTPNEHVIIGKQLEVFRHKCPFYKFIKSKPVKYGTKVSTADDAKNFYA